MYENQYQSLLPRPRFFLRLALHFLGGLALVGAALGLGMAGYHGFEGLPWVDAFVNASMILSGMGPVDSMKTSGGKIFAGCYALFSGLAFIVLVRVILAPAIHRALHKFHLEDQELEHRAKKTKRRARFPLSFRKGI